MLVCQDTQMLHREQSRRYPLTPFSKFYSYYFSSSVIKSTTSSITSLMVAPSQKPTVRNPGVISCKRACTMLSFCRICFIDYRLLNIITIIICLFKVSSFWLDHSMLHPSRTSVVLFRKCAISPIVKGYSSEV